MAEKNKDAPWQTISDYFVGTIIKHEGIVVAVMQGENKVPTAKRSVECLNALDGIENPETYVKTRAGMEMDIKDIRTYLKIDENESTFDEVVRRIEREIKKTTEINDELQTVKKENEAIKSKINSMSTGIMEVKENFEQLNHILKNL